MIVEFCSVYTDTMETDTADDLDLNVNQLYTGVTISNPLPVTRENSYTPHMPTAKLAAIYRHKLLQYFQMIIAVDYKAICFLYMGYSMYLYVTPIHSDIICTFIQGHYREL